MIMSGTTSNRLILSWLLVLTLAVASFPSSTQAQSCNDGEWLADLPSLGTFSSTSNSTDSGLGILIDWANGFINIVQPNDLPYELIRDGMNQTLDDRFQADQKGFILQGMEYMAGFIVCLLIGILYILIMPIVCLCFCCCRCCGCCGGKRVQKVTKYSTCKRVYFSISLLLITVVMGAGVACTSLSNDWVSESNGEIYDSFTYMLDDTVTFLDGAVGQLEHITSCELFATTDRVMVELDNIGTRLGVPLQEYVNDTCAPIFQELDTFTETLDEALVVMEHVNDLVTVLEKNATMLATELEDTATQLDSTVGDCGSACDMIDTSLLTIGMNFSSLPNLTEDLGSLKELLNGDFSNETEKAKDAFNGIPQTIEDQTAVGVHNISTALTDLEEEVAVIFHNATQLIDDMKKTVEEIKVDSQYYWDLVKQIDDYRYYTVIGLACLTLLIVVINVAGMSMGLCGTKRDAHPMERTRLSNAGGNILMAGVAFSFFFSWLLILIVMILFFALGNVGQLCEPLNTLEIWEETIDYPYLLNDEGYLLSGLIYDDPSINLTVSGILSDCGLDLSLYNALMLEHQINLTVLTNYKDNLEIESAIHDILKDIDLSSLTIFPDELNKTLLEFKSTLQSLNESLSEYTEMLSNNNITEVDLLVYADRLYDLSVSLDNDTISPALNESAADLTRIHYQYVVPMEIASDMLLDEIDKLGVLSLELQNSIDDLIVAFEEADEKISSNDTLIFIENELLAFSDELLNYTDQYVEYTVYQISEELARCKPIRTIYDSAVVALCNYAIDSLHLIWFTLGWCMFFYVPSIIFAVKLAKYYRIMSAEHKSKSKKKKKKKGKDDVEDLAMKDMNGEPEIPPYGEDSHSGNRRRTNHPRYDADTNQLIQGQSQGAAAAGAVNYNYNSGPKTNPHYIHDDPIMAYDNPRGGRPPPYNDPRQYNGVPAAYQFRPLPEAPHANTRISSQHQTRTSQHESRSSQHPKHKKKSSASKSRTKHRESSKQHVDHYPKQKYPSKPVGNYSDQRSSFSGSYMYPSNQFSGQRSSQYGRQGSGYYDYPQGMDYGYQRSSSYQPDGEDYLMPHETPQINYFNDLYRHGPKGKSRYEAPNSGSNWSFGSEPQQGRQATANSTSFTQDVNHLY